MAMEFDGAGTLLQFRAQVSKSCLHGAAIASGQPTLLSAASLLTFIFFGLGAKATPGASGVGGGRVEEVSPSALVPNAAPVQCFALHPRSYQPFHQHLTLCLGSTCAAASEVPLQGWHVVRSGCSCVELDLF